MGKNVFKSIIWVGYYLFVQTISLICLCVYYIISDKISFWNINDGDMLASELMNLLYKTTIPSLIISAIVIIITFLLYILIRKHQLHLKETRLKESVFFLNIGIAANGIISVVLLGINYLIEKMFGNLSSLLPDTNVTDLVLKGQPFWVLLLGTGILVPIMEEIVFRYGLCGTLARNNKKIALIISAVVFGVMHGNLIQGTYATVLGLIMGAIYMKYNNLIYSILIHIAINSSSVIVSQIGKEWIIYVVGVISLLFVIYMLKKNPELKEFEFLKEKHEYKKLPSLKDIQKEKVDEETYDFKEE